MKTNLQLKLILFLALAMASTTNLVAQTYNSGTWYSYYDAAGFTINTINNVEIKNKIFAPTSGTLSLQWKYEYSILDFTHSLGSHKTHVYESANNGTKTTEKFLITGCDESWQNKSGAVSANINYLKFDRPTGNTSKVYYKEIKLPLAQHILLADGTYGTADYTEPYDFGSVKWGETATAVDEVALRSFLSAGNITVSSSLPSVFRINSADNTSGITYSVGANACASSNGAAEQPCAEGVLGNISLYGFKIYFCPQEAQNYEGTITITDGVSTATVAVKGVGLKQDQTITFEPASPIYDNATIAPAETSSQLAPTYTFEPENIVTWAGEAFAITPLTDSVSVKITAAQAGNNNYNAATPVTRTITILPSKTYGTELATVCAGETFNYDGKDYPAGVHENIIFSAKNRFGSDSLVTLTVNELPTYLFPETKTIYVGKDSTWREKSLAEYTVGVHNLYDSLKTVADCDSVYQLTLTVVALPTTYGKDSAFVCPGDTVEYEGMTYGVGVYQVTLKNWLLGDSIVTFQVNELSTYLFPENKTIYVGKDSIWREKSLAGYAIGEYILYDSLKTVAGCDSVYQLSLTVIALPTTYGTESATVCAGESFLYYEQDYFAGEHKDILLPIKNYLGGDTLVTLTVNEYEVTPDVTVYDSIFVGDEFIVAEHIYVFTEAKDTTIIDSTINVHGCDSVIYYEVNVAEKGTPTQLENATKVSSVTKFVQNGTMYIRRDNELFGILGNKID